MISTKETKHDMEWKVEETILFTFSITAHEKAKYGKDEKRKTERSLTFYQNKETESV